MLKIHESAVEQIKCMQKSDFGFLKIELNAGGCSGFEIAFDWVKSPDLEDLVFENLVCIHPDFLELMGPAILTYETGLMKRAFVLKVDMASSTCGCGMSFSI